MTRAEPECGVGGQPVLLSAGLVLRASVRAHTTAHARRPRNVLPRNVDRAPCQETFSRLSRW